MELVIKYECKVGDKYRYKCDWPTGETVYFIVSSSRYKQDEELTAILKDKLLAVVKEKTLVRHLA